MHIATHRRTGRAHFDDLRWVGGQPATAAAHGERIEQFVQPVQGERVIAVRTSPLSRELRVGSMDRRLVRLAPSPGGERRRPPEGRTRTARLGRRFAASARGWRARSGTSPAARHRAVPNPRPHVSRRSDRLSAPPTMAAAHRCTPPTWVTRSRTVQPGQDGTVASQAVALAASANRRPSRSRAVDVCADLHPQTSLRIQPCGSGA